MMELRHSKFIIIVCYSYIHGNVIVTVLVCLLNSVGNNYINVLCHMHSSLFKNARKWELPSGSVDHYDCLLWFQPLCKARVNWCCHCTELLHYLWSEIKRRKSVTLEQKALRTLASSHCPVKYLLLTSVSKHVKRLKHEKQDLTF